MAAILSVAVFIAVFALPLVPGLFELAKPRDNGSLPIALAYARDPRFFARSFRAKIAGFRHSRIFGRIRFLSRHNESATVGDHLSLPPKSRNTQVQIARDRLVCGAGATMTDGYGANSIFCGESVAARALCSDGDIVLGDRCTIERWIDAESSLDVGSDCSLGTSASSGGIVTLGSGVRFERVFGASVTVRGAGAEPPPKRAEDVIVLRESDIAKGADFIVRGNAVVTEGTVLDASIKAHGSLFIEPGVRIMGNAVARGELVLLDGSVIEGHAFGERGLFLGADARVGVPGQGKTAYTAGNAVLCDGATVHGWVVAERGGWSA
ncbi:MAG: hypothetical protein WCA52_04390 [Candidatus Aquilonibacter sp.]